MKAVEPAKLEKGGLEQNQHRGKQVRAMGSEAHGMWIPAELPLDSFAQALKVRSRDMRAHDLPPVYSVGFNR